jgi:hypothetical protein
MDKTQQCFRDEVRAACDRAHPAAAVQCYCAALGGELAGRGLRDQPWVCPLSTASLDGRRFMSDCIERALKTQAWT